MPSSLKGKADSPVRLVSNQEAIVVPEDARPTDDTPTVISKTAPLLAPPPLGNSTKGNHLNGKTETPESIVAGLRGRHLAHYELIEPIGVGGMAAVIRARDTQLDRFVALKILPPEMAKEKENVDRFHQEAKAAAKLDHANVARVFYCGEDQGLHYIAFEYVEGMNLRGVIEKRGRLPVPEAIRYVIHIATGLEHAATRGVVHRDVKPSNIIITPQGQAKLVDMGLARNLERNSERDLTQSGMTLGTFDYISPEQALEPREADSRSDIYSLGCTFYHMLTGQPPVPDGTPAKKLDHHQHHAPIDPRQLNPEIPDEIVAILVKMMAKKPKDRYQRPIQLVQHLAQVARQFGGVDDFPEVLLFMDTPLSTMPRSRPLLYIGMALATLAAVVLLLSFVADPTPNGAGNLPAFNDKAPLPSNPMVGKSLVKPVAPSVIAPPDVIESADLAKVLKSFPGDDSPRRVRIKIEDSIDLATEGLVFKGAGDQTLELESADGDYRSIRFQYKSGSATPIALSLEGGKEVIFRRIKFEIGSEGTPNRPAALVAVRGVQSVKFEQCIFTQKDVQKIQPKRVPMASLLIDAPADAEYPRPQVSLHDCLFEGSGQTGGQVAIAVNGAADITVNNSAFRPHGTFFSFRDKCSLAQTTLLMQDCSGFVEMGPAFRFANTASALVRVQHSAFLRPGSGLSPRDGVAEQPGLIYLAGDAPLRFEGKQNLYYNLNALLETKAEGIVTKTDDFQKYLQKNKGSDTKSVSLDLAANPLQHPNPLATLDPIGFQLKRPFFRDYGLQRDWSGSDMLPPPVGVAKAIKKIVDADDNNQTIGVFSNLGVALNGAVDGDVIWIKHGEKSNEVEVPPVVLKPGISVTIKPFDERYQPILVLDPSFTDKDSYLFKVQKSKLQIEQMQILLAPIPGFETRSAVQMGEAAHCVFKNCTFSLRTSGDGKLNVATFFDLDRVMKMDAPASSPPKVEFHECFIRGKGDVVSLRGCRKLNVEMTNSLVALDGSLLDIRAINKEMAMDQGVRWNMAHSSIFTNKAIFAFQFESSKGLTRTNAVVKDCLLASLALNQSLPLVLPELSKEEFSKYLDWEGERNFYANFDNNGDSMRDWKEQVREMKLESGKLTFSPKLDDEMLRSLWDAKPDLFRPGDSMKGRIDGIGLPPESEKLLLPLPAKSSDEP